MSSLNWQKSSYSSEGSNCVELATAPDGDHVLCRESDVPGVVLITAPTAWATLIRGVREGHVAGV